MTKLTGITWTDGTTYMFRGDEYVAANPSSGAPETAAKPISASWPGVFESDIDAVVLWPNGKAYFFRGGEYIRYDVAADAPDEGYPKPIADGWPGVFTSDIDAVILGPGGQKAFIVHGGEYVSYDVATDAVDEGYPKPVAGSWLDAFASSDGGVQPIEEEEAPPSDVDGTGFTFELRAGEGIRERIARCCGEALAGGPLGQTERHDVYREFISCRQETTPDAAERLTGVKTSCAMFVRAIRHWCGAPAQGPYKPGTGMFTSMGGVSFGHPSFVKNDGSNVPQPGDYFYISSSQSSNDGHTGIFIEELSPGTWRTAEGGGGDGTLCRFTERPIAGNRFGNDPRTLWGWFDCTLVGIPE